MVNMCVSTGVVMGKVQRTREDPLAWGREGRPQQKGEEDNEILK